MCLLIFEAFISRPHSDIALISVTSFGSRINFSFFTLLSLLFQKERAPVIFFISNDEISKIGVLIKLLNKLFSRLYIVGCVDLKSYKKIVPLLDLDFVNDARDKESLQTLVEGREFIMTADDDVLYSPRALRNMVNAARSSHVPTVVFNTGMEIDLSCPYAFWNVVDQNRDLDVLPVGAGGILYPYSVLCKRYRPDFLEKAPTSDDIWLYSIMKEDCSYIFCSGRNFFTIARLMRQKNNLFSVNASGPNDQAIEKLLK